ncbi:DNA adenine methylase Dam [Paraburkholderia sp. BL6669N2]|uniref:DNA adenine methylase n=1 Tax=Paraburkholderia sp. BL6669N2 TaxID=1938807 RepID=UPI000E27EFBF|nr:DNA adenine methylase [Paraburkholderia sp. BL6669N2]REG49552.1 DNA adenine methylase Dam [Paraburkholderia sp. BL6669N2]
MQKHPTSQAAPSSRPFLKWVGGKSRVLQHVLPRLPHGRRLIEPFVGGGAIFLGTDYEEYLLGDSNSHLVELYREVAARPHEFIEVALPLFDESYRSQERYLEIRASFNNGSSGLLRAAQFLYLNKHGFNGLCRYNKKGTFNVPYGHPPRVPTFPHGQILGFANKARRATFVDGDFVTVMRSAVRGDVVYADPPYCDRDGAASFTGYGAVGFGMDRQQELAQLARELASRGVAVAISNHDCEFARELYAGAEIHSYSARRSVSADVDKRGNVGELLAIFR